MQHLRYTLAILSSGFTLALFSGCNTSSSTPQASRIAEYKSEYEQLSDDAQKGVANGFISRGQNQKTVYMALGKPDHVSSSSDGRVVTWTYDNFFPPESEQEKRARHKAFKDHASSDPLMDSLEAWRNNVPKRDASGDSNLAGRAPGQSWAEYSRYYHERDTLPDDAKKMVDDQARLNYMQAIKDPMASERISVKLDVIFIEKLVSDAIVNDAQSAFVSMTSN